MFAVWDWWSWLGLGLVVSIWVNVWIRIRVNVTVGVGIRVRNTAGGGALFWNNDVCMFLTPQFWVGEPAVRTNWSATYSWCPLNCSCIAKLFEEWKIQRPSEITHVLFIEHSCLKEVELIRISKIYHSTKWRQNWWTSGWKSLSKKNERERDRHIHAGKTLCQILYCFTEARFG